MTLEPTFEEAAARDEVVSRVLGMIRTDQTIHLPDFQPEASQPSDRFALQSVGIEDNPFGGRIGPFRYQFEGEDDLLHLFVSRPDGEPVTPTEAQAVVSYLFRDLPKGLLWYRPATYSHHFYVGHDVLLEYLPDA